MRYMLDTNICIYLMRHHPPEVAERFAKLEYGDVMMSSITLAELRYGVECRPESRDTAETALLALLTDVPVMAFDSDAATSYGLVRAAVRDRKRDALDRLIAAHAISLSVTLVTNNEADFKDYPGLVIENWAENREKS
ncbi:MAG TPA: type II toxin-antitoxin system VapC family toxin [Sulfuricella sp.]|nr:type II toxin-antitoxin system VapC family toxin [Sulfuricella sp.]